MLTWRFAVHLNLSLVELVGLVIEKTEVAYLKSFSCIVVKKTFQVTCGVASFQIQKMKLILFCRLPVSQWIWTPRSKSVSGYGPPLRRFEPPYQTFLLSILCIIFGNLFYLQAFLSMFFSITTQHFLNKSKQKKPSDFVPILPHSL